MLKKTAALFFIFSLLILPHQAYADGPIVKFSRGITNILTSPVEYLAQTSQLADEHNPMIAGIGGFIRGTLYTVARIVGGAYEVVTFFAPIPWNQNAFPENYAPLMDPPTGLEVLAEQQGRRSYLES